MLPVVEAMVKMRQDKLSHARHSYPILNSIEKRDLELSNQYVNLLQIAILSNLKFMSADSVNNVDLFIKNDVDSFLLQKEAFSIETFLMQKRGLNGLQDWCREKRIETENISD